MGGSVDHGRGRLGQRILSLLITIGFWYLAAMEANCQNSEITFESQFGTQDYKGRRAALLDSLGEGTAILYSQVHETEAGYRSDSDFWYLTGLDEQEAILILSPGAVDRETLLLPPRDVEAERWTGERPALSESLRITWGFNRIYRTGALDGIIVSRMKHHPTLHLISRMVGASRDVPPDLEYYGKVAERIPGVTKVNSCRFLENMRMVKNAAEIEAITKAIEVTFKGLTDLLREVRPGIMEFQLQGVLEESFKSQGAQFMAFEPIIGSGRESAILHYDKLNGRLEPGQLLLLDVGAEWDHYCADITRTIPIDGRFTEEQAGIYDIVLAAQKAAIDAIEPGLTLRDVDELAREVIREAGYVDDFIHSTSHHVGLDVHDSADSWRPLAPGMVITVEPGIYLPDSEIGVRIEDVVLVTGDGHKVLSEQIPRERGDVENWMQF
jgi:Xaa-Pro aminopeptidase